MTFSNLFKKISGKFNTFDQVKSKKLKIIDDSPQQFENGIVENDWGLGFEDDCNLTIYNNRTLENASSLKDFMGEKVIDIIYSDTVVEFVFSNNKKIFVSLKKEDWNGPEAMQLNYKGEIYIWN